VALAAGAVAGHVVFARCAVGDDPEPVALLGPLAVAPAHQGRGLGSGLVRAGLDRMRGAGVARIFVLGDPAYYGRHGFAAERRVVPPYPLPEAWRDAWQSVRLDGAPPAPPGTLRVPVPWRRPALWAA